MARTVPEIARLVRFGMSALDTEPFADLFAASIRTHTLDVREAAWSR
ncbi:hypothetical protein [Amycolatopsis eburnea]|nr:hypothetical protein [Amycolatopsis eburnea]